MIIGRQRRAPARAAASMTFCLCAQVPDCSGDDATDQANKPIQVMASDLEVAAAAPATMVGAEDDSSTVRVAPAATSFLVAHRAQL